METIKDLSIREPHNKLQDVRMDVEYACKKHHRYWDILGILNMPDMVTALQRKQTIKNVLNAILPDKVQT